MELTLGEKIKTLRKSKKMTQKELTVLAGYSDRSMITRIEKGDVDLPESKIRAIAKALGTTPEYLMGWDEKSDIIKSIEEDVDISMLNKDQLGRLEALIQSNNIMFFNGKIGDNEEDLRDVRNALTRAFIEILQKKGEL